MNSGADEVEADEVVAVYLRYEYKSGRETDEIKLTLEEYAEVLARSVAGSVAPPP